MTNYTAFVRTESTPFGVHTWDAWLRCERQAWLKELDRAEREPGKLSGVLHFDIGSIFHALLALHYS